MGYENRMEQHYAVSKSGKLVYISEAHDNWEDCFCPHCGCKMLKRCGAIRAWHFAHDYRYENEINKKCSYESYLHAFAKLRLKQWFEESKSIILHYKQPVICKYAKDCNWKEGCDECSIYDEKKIDLKKCLTDCKLEGIVNVGTDKFRADLLWSNPYNPQNDILIEIKVTHECTHKKKESHKRIIEFEVHSEEDVENIVANDIYENDTVKFYGFKPQEVFGNAIPARYPLLKFIYYQSGKAFVEDKCDCKTYRNNKKSALLEFTIKNKNSLYMSSDRQESIEKWRFYKLGLALAISKGWGVRNCYLCNYHNYDNNKEKLTCGLKLNESCESSDAISCSKYLLKDDFYHKNIVEFVEFSKNNIVDVWTK